MRRSVDFDDQRALAAQEIREVRPDRLLAHELVAREAAVAKLRPQARLGRCLRSPQAAGASCFGDSQAAQRDPPA
jgi:hypothetical protein